MTESIGESLLRERLAGVMREASRMGIDQVQAGGRVEKGFSVTARDGENESISYHEQVTARISVYHQGRAGSVSTTDASTQGLKSALEKAVSLASFAEPDPVAGLPDECDLALQYPDCDLHHPWEVSPEDAARIAIDIEKQALALDSRCAVGDGAHVATYDTVSCLMNSSGFEGSYRRSDHSMGVNVLAKTTDEMKSDYAYTASRLSSGLRSSTDLAHEVVQKVVGRLGAKPIASRSSPVIFSPEVALGFWGHLFNAMSGRRIHRQKSFLCNRLGQRLLRPGFTLQQQPHVTQQAGSMPYDSNGSKTEVTVFFDDGVFQSPMTSAYSARQLGVSNTGNASGVHHCVIPDDNLTLESMCERMGEGLLVMDVMGQGVDITTGDYSRGASGYWVSGGEIQHAVEGVTIASTLPEMLLGIQGLGSDRLTHSRVHAGSIWFNELVIGGAETN